MHLAEIELQAADLIDDTGNAAEIEQMVADIKLNYDVFLDPASPHGQMQDQMFEMNAMMEESLPGLFGMMRRRMVGQGGSMSGDISEMFEEQERRRKEEGELVSLEDLFQEKLAKMKIVDDLAEEQASKEKQRKQSTRKATMKNLDVKTGRKRFKKARWG
eukprot:COSAG02_NODE_22335_length_756_cov_0.694064_1_plen_160_part_00